MFLFSHPELYIWSPRVYIVISGYGLYPAFEMTRIGPAFVIKKFAKYDFYFSFLLAIIYENVFQLHHSTHYRNKHHLVRNRTMIRSESIFIILCKVARYRLVLLPVFLHLRF